jgi:hypothetical protein
MWSGAQQKVSRPHRRHARFSYLRPCSIAGEHFAKRDQSPNKFSGSFVSIVCIEPGSTRTIGRSARNGMLGVESEVRKGIEGMKRAGDVVETAPDAFAECWMC